MPSIDLWFLNSRHNQNTHTKLLTQSNGMVLLWGYSGVVQPSELSRVQHKKRTSRISMLESVRVKPACAAKCNPSIQSPFSDSLDKLFMKLLHNAHNILSGVLRLAQFGALQTVRIERQKRRGVYVFPITSCWLCAPFCCHSPIRIPILYQRFFFFLHILVSLSSLFSNIFVSLPFNSLLDSNKVRYCEI